MKLRNKKTGEIVETDYQFGVSIPIERTFGYPSYDQIAAYNSLSELNAEWEDYEEPKDYYFIRSESLTVGYSPISNTRSCRNRKEIGNYFETKEEAEKAVEKLKALQRLKDKGFRFEGWDMLEYAPNDNYDYSPSIGFSIPELDKDKPHEYPNDIEKYLDICFGGEE